MGYRLTGLKTTYPITSVYNLAYGAASIRKYNVHYPTAGVTLSACPIFVWAHAGQWFVLDKGDATYYTVSGWEILAKAGFVVIDINYTLAVDGDASTQFPQSVKDYKCVLSAIADGTIPYGDPNKITVSGMSAGAHLAMMVAFTSKATYADSEHTSQAYTIVGCVQQCGPTDLGALYDAVAADQTAITRYLGYTPTSNEAGALLASPINYVSPSPPRTLIQEGDEDISVIPAQGAALKAAFDAQGATNVARILYAGLGHSDNQFFGIGGVSQAVIDRAQFLNQYCR